MFSDDDSYQNNIFRNNGSGVAVMYTKNVVMKNNRFEQNWGGAAYGLLLKEISHSVIMNNVFAKNTIGIYAEGTGTTYLHHNEFRENGWALKIWGDCIDDTLMFNNFSGNTFDVSTNATMSHNFFQNNYWDHYAGYDLDKDSYGDIAYHPVSLYSKMTQESPYSLMLLHSFFVDILDGAEKMLPSVTPAEFRDDKPLMKPVAL
jgi:nitrous oxidase accessory protein